MKRWILLIVMAIFIAVPVIFWARTLVWGQPWGLRLYDVARFLALAGFVLIFFQYVLSSRIKWIERGIGLDKLFIFHRTFGIIGVTLILIHPLALFASDLIQGYGISLELPKLVGVFTLVILCVAGGAALLYRRLRLKYETWKTIHWVNYAVLPLAFVHSFLLGSDLENQPLRTFWVILAGLYVAVLIAKLWNRIQVKRHPFEIVDVRQETHDTWGLHFEGKRIDYKPGQFMIVQLVRDGNVSESHPFTISSSPTRDRISITVKSVGDFTSTIGDTKTSDRAYIDAPYGAFSFLYHDAPDLVFIAGGIGITPFLSMLRYIYDKELEKNVVLLWGNKTEQDIARRDELEQIAAEMASLKVVHVMSKQPDWPGEKGYINAEMLKTYVSDFENSQFFICGPPVMMTKVEETLRGLGVPKGRIHYERFALV